MAKPQGIIFTRVSNQYDTRDISIETQEASVRELFEARGIIPALVICERYSGADLRYMPKLAEVCERVRTGIFAYVGVHSLDRLIRNAGHLMWLLGEFNMHGVELLSHEDHIDWQSEFALFEALLRGKGHEQERKQIAERTRRGKIGKMLRGHVLGIGLRPYGYTKVQADGKRAIIEGEAENVRFIFNAYTSPRGNLTTVADELNHRGVLTPSASKGQGRQSEKWSRAQIRNILCNPIYKGVALCHRYKQEIRFSAAGHRYKSCQIRNAPVIQVSSDAPSVANYRQAQDEQPVIEIVNGAPAIVSEEIWAQAQHKLETNAGAVTRNDRNFYLLRGLVVCEACNNPMWLIRMGHQGQKYYKCQGSKLRERQYCGISYRALPLDAEVWQEVYSRISDPKPIVEKIKKEIANLRQSNDVEEKTRALQARIETIKRGEQRLLRTLAATDDETSVNMIERERSDLEQKRRTLEAELSRLSNLSLDLQKTSDTLQNVAELASRFRDELSRLSGQRQRQIIEALGYRIVIKPDKTWEIRQV